MQFKKSKFKNLVENLINQTFSHANISTISIRKIYKKIGIDIIQKCKFKK